MKYMVMECHLSYAVVLSEDGRFLKVANLHYEPGQTVTDVVELQSPRTKPEKKANRRWIASLAAMAACLALVVASIFQMGQTPYASVYLSINPEVRIDVDRKDVVVGLEGVNPDGETLIEDYSYRRKPLDTVMDELVDRAIQMGYLHEGGKITLTLDAEDGQWVAEHSSTLGAHLQERLTEKLSVTIEIGGTKDNAHEVVVIPITPGTVTPDSGYGESDYGETTAPTPAPDVMPVPDPPPAPPVQTEPPAVSDLPSRDDGQTDYGPDPDDDGQSSYGQSDYDIPNDEGQSNYNTPDDDDGQSNYIPPTSGDGQSNYEDSDDDDEQSNYGQSDYEASDDEDGHSDYEDD